MLCALIIFIYASAHFDVMSKMPSSRFVMYRDFKSVYRHGNLQR